MDLQHNQSALQDQSDVIGAKINDEIWSKQYNYEQLVAKKVDEGLIANLILILLAPFIWFIRDDLFVVLLYVGYFVFKLGLIMHIYASRKEAKHTSSCALRYAAFDSAKIGMSA